MSAVLGMINACGFPPFVQNDPYKTLEYLGRASLLLRRPDEGE